MAGGPTLLVADWTVCNSFLLREQGWKHGETDLLCIINH